jgi:hypothetical protein
MNKLEGKIALMSKLDDLDRLFAQIKRERTQRPAAA